MPFSFKNVENFFARWAKYKKHHLGTLKLHFEITS